MKNKVLIPTILGGIFLVGLMLSLCGLGLSMGFKKMSLFGFFGALALLVLLRGMGSVISRKDRE